MKTKFPLITSVFMATTSLVWSQGTILFQHLGDTDPTNEGFTFANSVGETDVGPISNDLGSSAWYTLAITTGGHAWYTKQLTEYQTALVDADWTLSFVVRIVTGRTDNMAGTVSILGTPSHTFAFRLGVNADGNTVVRAGLGGLDPVYVIPGTTSLYHEYQLSYSAASQTASLWVDGTEGISDIGGDGTPGGASFMWGVGQGGPTQANWSEVTLTAIPEPSSLALLSLAGLFFAARRFRRRCQVPRV